MTPRFCGSHCLSGFFQRRPRAWPLGVAAKPIRLYAARRARRAHTSWISWMQGEEGSAGTSNKLTCIRGPRHIHTHGSPENQSRLCRSPALRWGRPAVPVPDFKAKQAGHKNEGGAQTAFCLLSVLVLSLSLLLLLPDGRLGPAVASCFGRPSPPWAVRLH